MAIGQWIKRNMMLVLQEARVSFSKLPAKLQQVHFSCSTVPMTTFVCTGLTRATDLTRADVLHVRGVLWCSFLNTQLQKVCSGYLSGTLHKTPAVPKISTLKDVLRLLSWYSSYCILILITDYFLRNYHCNAYKRSHQRFSRSDEDEKVSDAENWTQMCPHFRLLTPTCLSAELEK